MFFVARLFRSLGGWGLVAVAYCQAVVLDALGSAMHLANPTAVSSFEG